MTEYKPLTQYLVYCDNRPVCTAGTYQEAEYIAGQMRLRTLGLDSTKRPRMFDSPGPFYTVGSITDSPYGDPDADPTPRNPNDASGKLALQMRTARGIVEHMRAQLRRREHLTISSDQKLLNELRGMLVQLLLLLD